MFLAFSLGIFLTITEAGVRLMFPELKDASACHKYHPIRYWALKPNAHITEHFGGTNEPIDIAISYQGLRDREYGDKANNEYRIIVLGDSFIFGKGVNAEDTIPKQLERLFREKNPDRIISVINLSTEGYGPFQERHLINETGFLLEPDMVIMSIFVGNDIEDTMREHNLQRKSFHTFFEQRHFLLRNRDKWNYAFEYFLRRYWLTLSACSRYLGMPAEGAIGALLEGKTFPPKYHPLYGADNLGKLPYMEPELKEWYTELKQGLALMLEDIKRIQKDCQQRNIDFFVFTIPTQETVYDNIWESVIVSSQDAELYERGKGIRVLREALEQAGLAYIPVAECILKSDQNTTLYIPDNGHFNAAGCAFVADVLWHELMKSKTNKKGASEN